MFHLRMLGGLALDRDEAPFDGVPRKALALMAVVAAHPAQAVGRDRLMALLWPESDIERARGSLKQTVHVLRQLLVAPDALLGTVELRLNSGVVTSDVAAFRDATAEGDVERAVRLYAGPFLDGVHVESSAEFDHWTEETRAELARQRAGAIEQLARGAAAKGDLAAAARWWQMLQASDPLSGRIAITLMQAFDAAGDRPAALRHARVHAELLKQELDAAPDAEVQALAERLARAPARRSAEVTPPVPASESNAPPAPHSTAVSTRTVPRWRRAAVVSAAVGLALVLAVVLQRWRGSPAAARAIALDPKRVAVGAFENETGDIALAPLGKMASDWVTSGLTATGSLYVLDAATLYAQPPGDSSSPSGAVALARRNGAGLAVAGRFYRERDSLLFTASIYDVANGRVLNTIGPAAATAGEPLPAVEELRQRIAAALVAATDPRAASYFAGAGTRPPRYDAYREFVAGQEAYWRGRVDDGVAGFRRAAALDTGFLRAIVWIVSSSATLNRCESAESLMVKLEGRMDRLSAADLATVRGVRARCNRDWDHGLEYMRERSAAEPGSTLSRWAVTANARRANRPAEALALLHALDPVRDLGWMSDPGKVMYWREVVWAQHMLGDSAGARRAAAGLMRMAPRRLATAYFMGLAAVDGGRAAEAVRALDDVESMAADPPIVAGEIAGRAPADQVGTPAWVLYQIGAELLAVGDRTRAIDLARRAGRWLETRSAPERARTPSRYLRVLALELEGRYDSARVLVRQLARDEPADVEVRGRLGVLAARVGDRTEAMAIDASLAHLPPMLPPGAPQFERARIAAVLGERDRAIELLETLPYRAHPVDVAFFRSDPAFASLQGDERWVRMLLPKG